MVKLIPHPIWTELICPESAIYQIIDKALSCKKYEKEIPKSSKRKDNHWDGMVHFINRMSIRGGGHPKFPTGFLPRVVHILEDNNLSFEIDRSFLVYPQGNPIEIQIGEDRKYQREYVEKSIKRKRAGICSPTASGKTEIMMWIVANMGLPTLVLVEKDQHFSGMVFRMVKKFGIDRVGWIISSNRTIEQKNKENGEVESMYLKKDYNYDKLITIGMVGTISSKLGITKRTDKITKEKIIKEPDQNLLNFLHNQIKCLCVDEYHHVVAKTWQAIIKQCWAPYRYGFSATPDHGNVYDNMLLESMFGPIIQEVTMVDLIKDGYVAKPKIQMYYIDSPAHYDYNIAYKMWTESEKAYEMIKSLVVPYSLLLVELESHGKRLEQVIPGSKFIMGAKGAKGRKENDKAIIDLAIGKIKCLISTKILNEAIDIPEIKMAMNCAGYKDIKLTEQKVGRPIRKKKVDNTCIYVDFLINDQGSDRSVWGYMLQHSILRANHYESMGLEVEYIGVPDSEKFWNMINYLRRHAKGFNSVKDVISDKQKKAMKVSNSNIYTEEEKERAHALLLRFFEIREELGGNANKFYNVGEDSNMFHGAVRLSRLLTQNGIPWSEFLTLNLKFMRQYDMLNKCNPGQMTGEKAGGRWLAHCQRREKAKITPEDIMIAIRNSEKKLKGYLALDIGDRKETVEICKNDFSKYWLWYEQGQVGDLLEEKEIDEDLRGNIERWNKEVRGIKEEEKEEEKGK